MNELANVPDCTEENVNPESARNDEAVSCPETAAEKDAEVVNPEAETATEAVAAEEPANAEPAAEESAAEESAAEEPVAEEPAAEEPAAEEPAAEEPATEEPDAEEPADEEDAEEDAGTKKYFEMPKEELIAELRSIIDEKECDRHRDVNAIKQAFFAIRRKELDDEFKQFAADSEASEAVFVSKPDPDEADFKDLLNAFHTLRSDFLAKEEEQRMENLARRNEIIEKLKSIASDIDNINLHIPEVRQLQDEFKSITNIPQSAVTDSWKNYQLIIEQIFDCLKMNKELRDLDFKKNYEIKRDLIEQAKALGEERDIVAAYKKLQILRDTWRETGPVAKDYRESLWNEFKEIVTEINKKHQEFFEARKEAEKANEEAKTAICEEIEALDRSSLKTFNDWEKATAAIKDMQERWKKLGFASHKVNNALFARFRKSCDDFFAEKAASFAKIKEELAENLAKKIALCEKAEALMDSTDFRKTAAEIRALQAEWRTIGSVPRKHSDAVWQRFLAACNHFFDARKQVQNSQKKDESENLAAKRALIDELINLPADTSKADAQKAVRDAQDKWKEIGHVPFKMKDKLYDDFRQAIQQVREKFDFREVRSRMNNFKEQIENFKGDDNKLGRERDRLLRALENKRGELQIYENNLGFLNIKSREGNSLVKEIERRSQIIRDEIAMLQKKIDILDGKEVAVAPAKAEETSAAESADTETKAE